MFSGAFHWWCQGSLKRAQHHSIIKCFPTLTLNIYTCAWVCIYDEDSPNPTLSYCARSRSMVCLMTASLALWRRPCRPLMPFISSICSSSESNLRRYLRKHKAHTTLVKYKHITELLIFAWKRKTTQIPTFTFQWFHRHLFCCKCSFLDPSGFETTAAFHLEVRQKIERDVFEREIWSFNASCL